MTNDNESYEVEFKFERQVPVFEEGIVTVNAKAGEQIDTIRARAENGEFRSFLVTKRVYDHDNLNVQFTFNGAVESVGS